MTDDKPRPIRLADDVWCLTCQHRHIPTIPVTTYQCTGGAEHGCGFGCWELDTVAAAHATQFPDHIVYPVVHQVVPHADRVRAIERAGAHLRAAIAAGVIHLPGPTFKGDGT